LVIALATYLCLLTDGLVNDIVVRYHLLFCGECQVLHTRLELLEIDVTQPSVEQDLAGEQFEFQSELLVVDIVVPSEVKKRVVEIGQCLFKVAHQEVGDALLEVGDCQVLVVLDGAEVAIDLSTVSEHVPVISRPSSST
jgi:hypothetical protein